MFWYKVPPTVVAPRYVTSRPFTSTSGLSLLPLRYRLPVRGFHASINSEDESRFHDDISEEISHASSLQQDYEIDDEMENDIPGLTIKATETTSEHVGPLPTFIPSHIFGAQRDNETNETERETYLLMPLNIFQSLSNCRQQPHTLRNKYRNSVS